MPCSDQEECTNENKVEQSIITQNNEHNQHDHPNEQCTPFCICNCCGAHSFNAHTAYFQIKVNTFFADKEKQKSIYNYIYLNDFSSTIWQPPKLS